MKLRHRLQVWWCEWTPSQQRFVILLSWMYLAIIVYFAVKLHHAALVIESLKKGFQ